MGSDFIGASCHSSSECFLFILRPNFLKLLLNFEKLAGARRWSCLTFSTTCVHSWPMFAYTIIIKSTTKKLFLILSNWCCDFDIDFGIILRLSNAVFIQKVFKFIFMKLDKLDFFVIKLKNWVDPMCIWRENRF